MKRNRIIIVLCFLAVVAALAWWLLESPNPVPASASRPAASVATPTPLVDDAVRASPTPSIDEERKKQVLDQINRAFSAPIAFYGKVIDQYGDPVPNADVGYTAADKFNASGSHYTGKSDAEGFFEISGIKGAGLLVGVGKQGYYPIDGKSSASFAYGMGPDSYRQPAPTEENPAIFELHKMGETEPLVRVEKSARIPKNGTPSTVDLANGSLSSNGNFRVEAWTEAPVEDRKFDWRCRVTVLGGGLIERNGQFDFEAPEDGYEENIEIDMPASLGDEWNYTVEKSYFVETGDGHYARFDATIQAAHDNPTLRMDSYLNPKNGSRNLEFDPTKKVKP